MSKFHESPVTYISHVKLKVSNLPISKKFYTEIIGLKILDETDREIVLTADGITKLLTLNVLENPESKWTKTTGLYHVALLLPTRDSLTQFVRHLLEKGIRFGSADHLVSEAIYLDDPDGNGIEVYRDRDAADWSWVKNQVVMATEPIDFEDLLEIGSDKWYGMPQNTKLGHLHLHVANLAESEKFYQLVGFDVVTHYPGALFMSAGNYHHHLGLNIWNGSDAPPAPANYPGLDYFEIKYANEVVLQDILGRFNGQNIRTYHSENGIELQDPSGNKMRLII